MDGMLSAPFYPTNAKLERMLRSPFIHRLDDRDRALYLRWVIRESASKATLVFWTVLTHVGGIGASIAFALVPLVLAEGHAKIVAVQAAWALAISHLIVQVIKRNVGRARPGERVPLKSHVELPDRFSFPSGHAAAVMSVAFIHAANFHSLGLPMLALAALVGFSRVRLGVHYPGDVLVGQFIAIATGIAVRALW
jgi:undecaprenyl-diphosphatase